MRHINLNPLLEHIFADVAGVSAKKKLERAHRKLAAMPGADRQEYTRRNGPNKWKPIKDLLTGRLGKKCWYTEWELIGAPLVVDHYRPVCTYWWLAYSADNYRVACPWSNSPEHNAAHGCAGGKGESFPLLAPQLRARGRSNLRVEKPIILDPCKKEDCDLIAFHSDGRPILNPIHAANPVALRRVEESKILLNLDHPDFNTKREQLCIAIRDEVNDHEALPSNSPQRAIIRTRLGARLSATASFSAAARYYLQLHRHLDWVQDILNLP